jgi:ribosomal protein S18 acetylase RimI-like enzyme
MTDEIKIRFARDADSETLAEIGARSFYDAFAGDERNRPEDMRAYMDENFTVEALRADLRKTNVFYLIGEVGDRAAGYAKLQLDSKEECVEAEKPIELCRLYALDEFIGKGVGKALMNECFKIAAEKSCDFLWLGVWEFNFRAQKFYGKFGFEKCGEHIFQLGSDPQIDWILRKIL